MSRITAKDRSYRKKSQYKIQQLNVFSRATRKKAARIKAIDQIKNRFGQKYITKANTLERVEGNKHFLGRS
jgi:hypothetical protein